MGVVNQRARNVFAGPGASFVLTLDVRDQTHLRLTKNGSTPVTDFSVAGSILTLGAPLGGGDTLLVERVHPLTQSLTLPYSAAMQEAFDGLTLQVQQVADKANRNLVGHLDGDDLLVEAPDPNKVVAWNEDGTGLSHYPLADLLGAAPAALPLSIANGGVTGDPATGLGLGTAAVKNTEVAGGVPLIGGSNLLPSSVLPVVETSGVGAAPAFGANGRVVVSLPGTLDQPLITRSPPAHRTPLKEVAVGAVSSVDCRAVGAEWDTYPAFEIELIMYAGVTGFANLRFDIGGAIKSGASDYAYINLLYESAGHFVGADDALDLGYLMYPASAASGHGGSVTVPAGVYTARFYVSNPEALDPATTIGPSLIGDACCVGANTYAIIYPGLHIRSLVTGFWRGLQLRVSAGTFDTGGRIRVWGLPSDPFAM